MVLRVSSSRTWASFSTSFRTARSSKEPASAVCRVRASQSSSDRWGLVTHLATPPLLASRARPTALRAIHAEEKYPTARRYSVHHDRAGSKSSETMSSRGVTIVLGTISPAISPSTSLPILFALSSTQPANAHAQLLVPFGSSG